MKAEHIGSRSLTVWRIRITLVALVPAVVAAVFFAPFTAPWWWINGINAALYLFGFLLYFPLFCKHFLYSLDETHLIMTCGVFYRFQPSIPLDKIQYTVRMQWPIPRLFGLVTLIIQTPGGKIHLMHLSSEEADRVQALVDGRHANG